MRRLCVVTLLVWIAPASAAAQDERRVFAGVLIGVSTLSADGRAVTSAADARISLYKPENGLAIDALAGFHVSRFISLQLDYVWNRNDLTLVSSFATPERGGFYEQQRRSAQHVVAGNVLLYFRRLGSGIRPYLGTGICLVHFASRTVTDSASSHLEPPTGDITANTIAVRSHVGIDVALSRAISIRYSFSETISGNPISAHLMPPGKRGLANFQNLFGLVAQF